MNCFLHVPQTAKKAPLPEHNRRAGPLTKESTAILNTHGIKIAVLFG
jgi:hypothetical protein